MRQWVLEVIEGKRRGRPFLYLLSALYRVAVFLRNKAYDFKWLKAVELPIAVISVGNIVAGGTGKTPLVRLLAAALSAHTPIAILSRGYRSRAEHAKKVTRVLAHDAPIDVGDEPLWLAQQLPHVPVFVGKNRTLSAERAAKEGAKILLLDDGMQYRKLKKNLEIVVMDGEDLFGRGHFLPRGFLRDTPTRLKEADLIVINGGSPEMIEELRAYTSAPCVFVRMRPKVDLRGKQVAVFCAIGSPNRFLQTVRESGAEVIATFFKSDHDPFTEEELEAFAKRSKAELFVCTEKDGVKLKNKNLLPIVALESELEITAGKENWDIMVQKVLHGSGI